MKYSDYKKIVREDCYRFLQPGVKVLRVLNYPAGSMMQETTNEIDIVKAPYKKYVPAFGRDCEFVGTACNEFVAARHTLPYYEYFLNDLFNGDIYLLQTDFGKLLPDEMFEIDI